MFYCLTLVASVRAVKQSRQYPSERAVFAVFRGVEVTLSAGG